MRHFDENNSFFEMASFNEATTTTIDKIAPNKKKHATSARSPMFQVLPRPPPSHSLNFWLSSASRGSAIIYNLDQVFPMNSTQANAQFSVKEFLLTRFINY